MKTTPPRDWLASPAAFDRFLQWLDDGSPSGGGKYLEIRHRLVCYFDRKGCVSSNELADETLSRVARRLEEERGAIDLPPAQYCYVVAKFVLLEHLRGAERRQVSIEALSPHDQRPLAAAASCLTEPSQAMREKLAACLELCLEKLTRDNRTLIEEYYRGERRVKIEHRRTLAARLGLTMNALTIKTCRIRSTLETCVKTCAEKE